MIPQSTETVIIDCDPKSTSFLRAQARPRPPKPIDATLAFVNLDLRETPFQNPLTHKRLLNSRQTPHPIVPTTKTYLSDLNSLHLSHHQPIPTEFIPQNPTHRRRPAPTQHPFFLVLWMLLFLCRGLAPKHPHPMPIPKPSRIRHPKNEITMNEGSGPSRSCLVVDANLPST